MSKKTHRSKGARGGGSRSGSRGGGRRKFDEDRFVDEMRAAIDGDWEYLRSNCFFDVVTV